MSTRRFEVLTKDISHARLTIAKDRITLKVMPITTPEEKEKLIRIAKIVDSRVPAVEFTIRGPLHDVEAHGVRLYPKGATGKKEQATYYFTYADLNSSGNV
jgi:hypothetical protein